MTPEIQLAYNIGTAVGVSAVISGLAAISATDVEWNWRKYLYTLGITGFGALAVVEGIQGGVTAANFVTTALAIFGASFLGNKLIKLAGKLKDD